jgi:hypothetical protein
MKNKLERIWEEAVVVHFKVLFGHFPAGNEKRTKNISQDSLSQDRDLKLVPPEYEA